MSNIIAAAEITNADAIHPGFLSENSKFSKNVRNTELNLELLRK
jgi:acetyl/propionyl-CoA carboxylase alpha subunit